MALQFVNDLHKVLIQIRRALDGLFLAALMGGRNCVKLRPKARSKAGFHRASPFADLREVGALLQRAGFALPVIDSDRLTVRYNSVFDLMRDMFAAWARPTL